MTHKLIAEKGLLKGLIFIFDERKSWVIGRDHDACQLLVEDPKSSRKHALFKREENNNITITNFSLTNPVLLNDENISTTKKLYNGDMIKIGDTIFRFHVDSTEEIKHDTIYKELDEEEDLEETNFQVIDSSRWLLKVIVGTNTGAEFPLETSHCYIIGTDTTECDIIFHDMSVSRKHAKVSVSEDEVITITDLNSKNGIFIDSKLVDKETILKPNQIITIGTTTLLLIDREQSTKTVISPSISSLQKLSQQQDEQPEEIVVEEEPPEEILTEEPHKTLPEIPRNYLIPGIFIVTIIFIILISFLFKSSDIVVQTTDYQKSIEEAINGFQDVEFTFNKRSGKIFLLGHVLTYTDRAQLIYNLKLLSFISQIEDHTVVDEGVWQEMNQILNKVDRWRSITVHSPKPGSFIVKGYLKTRKEAEALTNYINLNFPFVDLIINQVVVEEDLYDKIASILIENGFAEISVEVLNGEVTLIGLVSKNNNEHFANIIKSFKEIHGVRIVKNFTVEVNASSATMISLTDKYSITGISKGVDATSYSVVINGRILTKNDIIDEMKITKIYPNRIELEKDGIKYKIDYNK